MLLLSLVRRLLDIQCTCRCCCGGMQIPGIQIKGSDLPTHICTIICIYNICVRNMYAEAERKLG